MEDSHEISSLIFSKILKKKYARRSPAVVVIGPLLDQLIKPCIEGDVVINDGRVGGGGRA